MKTITTTIILFVALVANVYGTEYIQFNFQKYNAENSFNLFKLNISLKDKKGKLCFFETEWSSLTDEQISTLHKKQWVEFIDFNKQKHSCFTFFLYENADEYSFYSPEVKYGDSDFYSLHTFFFKGKITKTKLHGNLYEFRDFRPEQNEHYRTAEQYEIYSQIKSKMP